MVLADVIGAIGQDVPSPGCRRVTRGVTTGARQRSSFRDFDKYRRLLWKRGIKPMIAWRGVTHGSGLGKVRWVVERVKRLRIRYERRADLHQGLLELACSLICLRRLRTSS